MDDILGAEKHHSLGFKQHPLEEAGKWYFVYVFLMSTCPTLGNWFRKGCNTWKPHLTTISKSGYSMPTLLEVLKYTHFAEVPGSFACSKSPLRTEKNPDHHLNPQPQHDWSEAPFSLLIKCTMRPDSRFAFRSGFMCVLFVAKPQGSSYTPEI